MFSIKSFLKAHLRRTEKAKSPTSQPEKQSPAAQPVPEQPASQPQQEAGNGRFFACVVSDVGLERSNNEDNFILGQQMNPASANHCEFSYSRPDISDTWQFAGIFDGMGGGEAGELASKSASEIFLDRISQLSASASRDEIDAAIRQAFQSANNSVVQMQATIGVFGTTGTVICTNGNEYKIYHMGDSRGYLFHEQVLTQLTKDQTLARMKIEVGLYKEDDPQAEYDKHKLTEYIGRDWSKENTRPVESIWCPLQSGDSIMLCSDGLYDMCTDGEIAEILMKQDSAQAKALQLVNSANAHGGVDNTTCIVLDFK